MTFHVGQKVARFRDGLRNICADPAIGEAVTISWIGDWQGTTVIDLIEYPAPETLTASRGYDAAVFRPLVERKTDTGMAILKKIAADASKKLETT